MSSYAAALRAAMKATAVPKPKKLPEVPGWGTLYVKPLTVEEVDLQQQEIAVEGKDPLRFARGVARLLCDENGDTLFDPSNPDDLQLLAKQPWDMLQGVIAGGGVESATSEAGSAEVKNG
jgi:hypothetical protein